MQTSGPFLSTATHHSFMDDDAMSAAERRKSYQKNMKAGKGHSLDDSSMASHSTGGMKAAASESQLNESNDSFLSPPKDKRSASKLSLLADKVLGVSVLQRERKEVPCFAWPLNWVLCYFGFVDRPGHLYPLWPCITVGFTCLCTCMHVCVHAYMWAFVCVCAYICACEWVSEWLTVIIPWKRPGSV